MVIFANRFFPIRCGRTVSCKRFRSAQRAAVRFFAAATARHLSCGSRGGEKTLPFLLCATPSLGSRRRRRSGTGGFAWRTASHLTIACDNLLSVSGGPPAAHAARRAGAPENGCAAKRSSKPGAGSPLLTGGSCRARCSDGRPGPVLDATLPSSPVFSWYAVCLIRMFTWPFTPPRRWPWRSPWHASSSGERRPAARLARRTSIAR